MGSGAWQGWGNTDFEWLDEIGPSYSSLLEMGLRSCLNHKGKTLNAGGNTPKLEKNFE